VDNNANVKALEYKPILLKEVDKLHVEEVREFMV